MKVLHTLLILSCLVAQVQSQQKGESDAKAKIRKKVAAMRKAMRSGAVKRFNVYATVRLKNGNRIKGVVKNGQFIEVDDGLDFVPANRRDRRAGLRLWYTAGANSFIFIPYNGIQHYEIGSTLSDNQVKAIELRMVKKSMQRRAEYLALLKAKEQRALAAKAVAEGGAKGAVGPLAKKPALALTPDQKKLLLEFPAAAGWGEKKLNDLKMRRINVGVYPNDQERKFEKGFAAWKQAREVELKIEAAAKGKVATKEGAKTGGAKQESGPVPPTGGATGSAKPPAGGPPMPGSGK